MSDDMRAIFAVGSMLGWMVLTADDSRHRPLAWIMFALMLLLANLPSCAPAHAYDVAVTFDTVPDAEAYIVNVNDTITVIAAGGDEFATTTVSVRAMGRGQLSAPSNTITLPPLVDQCTRYDVDSDGNVTTSDVLEIMLTVTDGVCQ